MIESREDTRSSRRENQWRCLRTSSGARARTRFETAYHAPFPRDVVDLSKRHLAAPVVGAVPVVHSSDLPPGAEGLLPVTGGPPPSVTGGPPPGAAAGQATPEEKLLELKSLYNQGLISQSEYEAKKQEVLNQLVQ
jgi:hypothetical protein